MKSYRSGSNLSDNHDTYSVAGSNSMMGGNATNVTSRSHTTTRSRNNDDGDGGGGNMNKSLSQLQKEADQQLELELETQMTLEHFMGQMISLKNAFAMLSDVVMHEVDAARSEARRRIDACDTTVSTNNSNVEMLQQQMGLMIKKMNEVEDKQDGVTRELRALRQQGEQTQSWLTSVSEQVTTLKEQMSDVQAKQVTGVSEVQKECSELKRHFDNQSHSIISRINECGTEISKQRAELTTSTEQRMDDLELLEKALSTLQAQQVRLRSGVDDSITPLQMEIRGLKSKTESIEAGISTLKMDGIELHSTLDAVDRDAKHRFENVSRVFKMLTNNLKIGTPPSVEDGFKGGMAE